MIKNESIVPNASPANLLTIVRHDVFQCPSVRSCQIYSLQSIIAMCSQAVALSVSKHKSSNLPVPSTWPYVTQRNSQTMCVQDVQSCRYPPEYHISIFYNHLYHPSIIKSGCRAPPLEDPMVFVPR